MKITLIAPFRTIININTDAAQAYASDLYGLLNAACDRVNEGLAGRFVTKKVPPRDSIFTKYVHLNLDYETWYATPLASLELKSDDPLFPAELVGTLMPDELEIELAINSLTLNVYDNTLAILSLDIEISDEVLASAFAAPTNLEQFLTELTGRAALEVQHRYVTPFLESLIAAQTDPMLWPNKRPLVWQGSDFIVFDDVPLTKYPHWDDGQPCLLWSHRVFDYSNYQQQDLDSLSHILRDSAKPSVPYKIGWGYTVLGTADPAFHSLQVWRDLQFFYALFDMVTHSQKRLYRALLNPSAGLTINQVSRRYERLNALQAELSSEFTDYRSGLQEPSRIVSDELKTAFRFEDLKAKVTERSDLIRERLSRMTMEKTLMWQKITTAAIILLGAIEIMAFVHNIYWYSMEIYSDDLDRDPTFGVTDIANSTSFDLLMNVAILLTIGLAVFWSFSKSARR